MSNFKNFNNIEVSLNSLNVIVGSNAAGKSNLLQSLKFIKDIEEYGIENAVSLQGGIEYLKNINLKGNKLVKLSIEFTPEGGRVIERIDAGNFIGLKFNTIIYSLEIRDKSKSKFEISNESISYYSKLQQVKYRTINDDPIDIQASEGIKDFGDFTYHLSVKNKKLEFQDCLEEKPSKLILQDGSEFEIDSKEIIPFPFPINFISPEFDNKKTLLEQFSFLIPRSLHNYSIYDFDLKNSKKPTSITAKSDLEEDGSNIAIVIKNILEDKEKTRRFSNLLTDILPYIKGVSVEKSQDKSLFFKVKEAYNNVVIPSSLLSDGTISITSIIVGLFFENNSLAAFEEPEHGIHPALIAKLMQFFYDESNNKQIIITTHNPEILKNTKIDDLLLVSRDSSGFTNINKPVEKEMVRSFLESDLGIDQLFIQNLLDLWQKLIFNSYLFLLKDLMMKGS